MSILAWVMMGIAVWHFAVLVPDRFYGGIVGAFIAAAVGAAALAFVINGFDAPGRKETELIQALIAVPGAIVGLAVCYWLGVRGESDQES